MTKNKMKLPELVGHLVCAQPCRAQWKRQKEKRWPHPLLESEIKGLRWCPETGGDLAFVPRASKTFVPFGLVIPLLGIYHKDFI